MSRKIIWLLNTKLDFLHLGSGMFQLFITSLPLNVNAFIDWTDFARGHACHFGMRQWACSVYSSKHWVQYNSQASDAEREAIVVISLMYITFSLRVHIALSICFIGTVWDFLSKFCWLKRLYLGPTWTWCPRIHCRVHAVNDYTYTQFSKVSD